MSADDQVNIAFSKQEILVLFEWLANFNEHAPDDLFEDEAERVVLNNFESQLEKILAEPFLDNYKDIIAKARSEIRKKFG